MSPECCPHYSGILSGYFRNAVRMFPEYCPHITGIGVRIALEYAPEPQKPQMSMFTPRKLEPESTLPSDVVATIRDEFVFIKLGGIDWRVLAVENNKALLISEKILESRPYNTEYKDITWEWCTLRKYLNSDFYNKLGMAKSAIAETRNNNPNNPWYGTSGGNETVDKIFLLSLDELVKYFGDSGDLRNKKRYGWEDSKHCLQSNGYLLHDQYDDARIAKNGKGEACWWWLRSPGDYSLDAAGVSIGGFVYVIGYGVNYDTGGVRPALWLNL